MSEQEAEQELFNILETALRMQGVKKPLTKEFYESLNELASYTAKQAAKQVLDGQIKEENLNMNYHVNADESEDFRRGFDEAVDQAVRATERRITDLQAQRASLEDK